jgi:glycosyltransferase involved in cell wall biosynthesis
MGFFDTTAQITIMHKLAFIVPTKDRPNDLKKLLRSLADQTHTPSQIIIVDASKPSVKRFLEDYKSLNITYLAVYPPSLSKQRNAGIEHLDLDITLAGFLDDDVVLEKDAIKNMINFWNSAEINVGGAAFNITNTKLPKWTKLKSFFYLDSPIPGKVLMSGCTSILGFQNQNISVDWLCGGATVWKREVVDNYKYDEWFKGTGYLEDVDFSFNVKKDYALYLVATAKLAHYSRPVKPEMHFVLGKWQIFNRMYIVKKYPSRGLSISKAWIATFGLILVNLGIAMFKLDRNALNRSLGNITGAWKQALGKQEQLNNFLK